MNNYVPTQPELAELQPPSITVQTVGAMVFGNAMAGVGAGVIVAILCSQVFHIDAAYVATWALSIGGVAFGALCVVRFGSDEIVELWEWQRATQTIAAQQDEIAMLHDRLQSLEQDINYERMQRAAQSRTPEPRRVDVMPQLDSAVRRDAEELLKRHFMGISFARDVMVQAGWTPTRWIAAMDVLKAAGIAQVVGKRTAVQVATMTEAVDRLNQAWEG